MSQHAALLVALVSLWITSGHRVRWLRPSTTGLMTYGRVPSE
jgi:hypothetical protein